MGMINLSSQAPFSFQSLNARTINEAQHLTPDHPSIVVNLHGAPASIDFDCGGYIPPLSSSRITAGTSVSGVLLGLFNVLDDPPNAEFFRNIGWDDFYEPTGDAEVPVLLRSPQQHVGNVDLIPADILADRAAPCHPVTYEVKLNLWFSPAGTNCGIHREHAFIETHTQLVGTGRMQKFAARSFGSLFEDQVLMPGQTQSSLFGRWRDGHLAYPWHQYRAESDAVWLAVEYHPLMP